MRPASLNNTVTLGSRMGASQYVNNTLTTVLSNFGAHLDADTPFGIDGNAVLCPPHGCYTPPHINILVQSYWSDPTSWVGGKVPALNEDVCEMISVCLTFANTHPFPRQS